MVGVVLASFAAFAVLPPVDLWVSGLFYDKTAGFWLADLPLSEPLRNGLWNLSTAMVVVASIALIVAAFRKRAVLGVHWRIWAYVLALYAFAVGVLANLLLKSHWGRARPAQITEFGGTAHFSLPYQITDQCANNCSFVSGEVTSTVALAISLMVIFSHRTPPLRNRAVLTAICIVLPLLTAAQRIATGRHFLTDALFAALFTLIVARLLWWAMKPART